MILKLFGCLIVLSLVACIHLAMRKHALLKSAEQFPGTVTDHIAQRGNRGRTVYALRIEYRDNVGVTKQFTTGSTSSLPARKIGDKVVVFEHTDGSNPDILVFEQLFLGYWLWFITGLTAAGCLVAPAVMRYLYLK